MGRMSTMVVASVTRQLLRWLRCISAVMSPCAFFVFREVLLKRFWPSNAWKIVSVLYKHKNAIMQVHEPQKNLTLLAFEAAIDLLRFPE